MAVYTTTLENINSGSLALVGGKGANLGELVSAGLPVPRAFCITTDAYRSFVDENAIAEQWGIHRNADPYYDIPEKELSRTSSRIRKLEPLRHDPWAPLQMCLPLNPS